MKPSVLLLLQGWGLSTSWQKNAIVTAGTPNFDNLWQRYEHKVLKPASDLKNLDRQIYYRAFYNDENFKNNAELIDSVFTQKEILYSVPLRKLFSNVSQHSSKLHLILTITADNEFGNPEHLFEIVRLAKVNGLFRIKIHLFVDQKMKKETAIEQINAIEKKLSDASLEISTVHPLSLASDYDYCSSLDLLLTGKGKRVLSINQAFSVSKRSLLSGSFITGSDPNFNVLDFDSVLFCDHTLSSVFPLVQSLLNVDVYRQRLAPKYLEVFSLLSCRGISMENCLISGAAKSNYFSKLNGSFTKGLILSDSSTIDLISSLTQLPENIELFRTDSSIKTTDRLEVQIENFYKNLKKAISKNYDFIIADLPFLYNQSQAGQFTSVVSTIKQIDRFLPNLESCILEADGILNISSFYGLAECFTIVSLPSGDLPELVPSPLPLLTISRTHGHKSSGTFLLNDLAFANGNFNSMKNHISTNSIN